MNCEFRPTLLETTALRQSVCKLAVAGVYALAIRAAVAAKGVEVLYNDLEERPGAKFAGTDLIGIPWQILVGPKGLAEGKVELKCRADGSRELLTPADAIDRLAT